MTAPVPVGGDGVEAAIEASSLGTPDAKALRASVSDETAARIVARADELGDIEAVLMQTGVTANTWQSAARRLANENARLRAALRASAPEAVGLCGQCGELESVMVKVGTSDGWCTDCLDRAAATPDAGIKALRWAADEMEAVIADGDVAEVAAPVPGEVGRSTVVSRRDALYEEPHTWLREYAALLADQPPTPAVEQSACCCGQTTARLVVCPVHKVTR